MGGSKGCPLRWWFVWLILRIRLAWLNQTQETKQANQNNKLVLAFLALGLWR